ncbi:4-amino-4-deoxy-L-arabinose transferase [Geitlerinema sp. P-1104]|uniref:ArnT family glycosyltransferase n=1 Tax=Geitlerinema sp. P-1104 TaxID=2546230 RepID=UPI001477037E|nr:glycosyltransferase family 39 protein [Geitlerinema sp. P-1104]NMG60087.1 4-amino-4-deoxy-L-arabinose transferase [Geitlerinema sp. P-1104]
MLILLPILAWGSFFLILHRYHRHPWREALLRATVIWGVTLAVITELLSGLQVFTALGVSLAWLGAIGLSALVVWRYGGRLSWRWPAWRWPMPLFPSILLAGVGWIVAITGILAIASAPNNPDSMRYHMSRVMHWIQQGTVAHYPTHSLKQLYQNPGSEFAIAQFQLLSGGDYFANLVQWGSMVVSLVGVSLIARQLGCERRGQILAVVLCATIPMGILQGASTQNDYVVSLWLVCFTYFSLLMVQVGVTQSTAIYIGASLGLAILSKGTAYIYAFPPGLALLIWTIRQKRRYVWQLGFLAVAIALLLNVGHYLRNLVLSGSPLGVDVGAETNSIFSLPVVIASFFKHLSLHADWVRALQLDDWITPTTGLTERVVSIVHTQLGLDLHNPDLLSPKSSRFYIPAISQYEDTSGNPLHLMLIGLALVLLVIRPSLRKQRELGSYALTLTAGFLMISSLLTWSPWRTRLHLPLFVLFTPIVARVLVKSCHPIITGCIALILLLSIQPWLFKNEFKPILGEPSIFSKPRLEQYFMSQPHLQTPYQSAMAELETLNCHQIGIANERLWFEYPIWMLLQNQRFNDSRIVHVAVENLSNQARPRYHPISGAGSPPCALLSITSEADELEVLTTEYGTYQTAWSTFISDRHGTLKMLVPN